jgi:hypothetical protein
LLGGCDRLAGSARFRSLLALADAPTDAALHALTPEDALAQEFSEADISPVFKANGSLNPQTPEYRALVADGFASYRLHVGWAGRAAAIAGPGAVAGPAFAHPDHPS